MCGAAPYSTGEAPSSSYFAVCSCPLYGREWFPVLPAGVAVALLLLVGVALTLRSRKIGKQPSSWELRAPSTPTAGMQLAGAKENGVEMLEEGKSAEETSQ